MTTQPPVDYGSAKIVFDLLVGGLSAVVGAVVVLFAQRNKWRELKDARLLRASEVDVEREKLAVVVKDNEHAYVDRTIAAAITMFNSLCDKQNARIDQLHRDMGVAQTRIATLEKDNAALRQQNELLKEQIGDVQGALDDTIKERERLEKEVAALAKRLARYEAQPGAPCSITTVEAT